uniref:Uncharacterized protein n=1 Tax=Anopheles farauti TaxID=69004 RepID=A0A182QKL7_9DIPT
MVLVLAICATSASANPTNPVFIQRELPPAPPYAYGLQDFDSSEEVTIVKRSGQTVLPQVTYLTTPQSDAAPSAQAQVQKQTPAANTVPQPLPAPLPLQQQQKPAKLPKKTPPQQKHALPAVSTNGGGSAVQLTVPAASVSEAQHPTAPNGASHDHTSLMEVELETAPRPEDLPQPAELDGDGPQHQKRNVYSKYASEVQPGGSCGCGGYVLVEKKIYVCEPRETIVRLMKRSHEDVCEPQETQHVGVIHRTAENPEQRFHLIPMPDGMEH